MKKTRIVALLLVLIMILPMVVSAYAYSDVEQYAMFRVVGDDDAVYVRLRMFAYSLDADVEWDAENRLVIITSAGGTIVEIDVEANGGFIENGISWVPFEFATDLALILFRSAVAEPVERLDLTLWEHENFSDIRETSFSTDLPHGAIAVNYIEHISQNLGARSAFTYSELETAVWIVEELLAMGHDWDNITVQEFTYWEINDMEIESVFLPLYWGAVTSRFILGVNREHLLRSDRVSQNVILTLPGQSERKIIVGAHYDSPPYPSASDNASGTALLLESAQRMLELEHYHTIVYVFFGAEEVGLVGAAFYYETLTPEERYNIVMMVNADVLIEGPNIIYGAGSMPTLSEEAVEGIKNSFIEAMTEQIYAMADRILADFEEMGVDMSLEELIDLMMESNNTLIEEIPENFLMLQALTMGLIEPEINDFALQVSEMATELNESNDFTFNSIPGAIAMPSDSMIFLLAGHTVVSFVGLDDIDIEDVEDENVFGSMLGIFTQYGFIPSILHSPYDEFHYIESRWPGMMNDNLHAFMLLLEEILTSVFSY